LIHDFCDIVTKHISENKAILADALTTGRVRSIEDYRFIVGQIRGLDIALSDIEKSVKAYLRDD
jgi:hypothetical protein